MRKGDLLPQVLAVMRVLQPFLHASRGRVAVALAVAVLLALVEIGTLLLLGFTVDSVLRSFLVSGDDSTTAPAVPMSLGLLIGLMAAGAVLGGLLLMKYRRLSGQIGERVAARIRDELWEHLQHLPMDYVRARGPGRLVPRFMQDSRNVQRLLAAGLGPMIQALVLMGITLAALLFLNLRMGVAVLAVMPLVGIVCSRLWPRLRHESRATRRCSAALETHLRERLQGMAAIKAFVRHTLETERFGELNRHLARRGGRRASLTSQIEAWSTSAMALGGIMALALVGQEFEAGRLHVGALVGFYALLGLLLPAVIRVTSAQEHLLEGAGSLARLLQLLDHDREQPSKQKLPDLRVTEGEILVQNVSCRLDKKTTLLPNTTLRARRGALTAVVGPDGCGGTVLLELLMRFRPPSKGRILIDGQDISGVSLKSLRSQVGWVAEASPLFEGTIRQNVAYGLAADTPLEQLQQAAKLAGADQFIDRLPKGWETRVGPGARRLSSGQRCQIALARAMAVNPAVLLVDEPADGLDPETESLFSQTLRSLARTRTVIVAARHLPGSLIPDQQFTLEAIPGTTSNRPGHGAGSATEESPDREED